MTQEALKLALEALENGDVPTPENLGKNLDAITAIKEALAQPEQEPINDGWQITFANGHSGFGVYAHMDEYPEEGSSLLCAVPQWAKEALNKSAYQCGYLDGIGRDCPQCKDYKAMYIKVRDDLAAEQQVTERQTARIVDLQDEIKNLTGEE